MRDNLQGRITELKSALEGVAIQFAQVLIPVVEKMVEHLKKFVDWLASLDDSQRRLVVALAGVAAAIGPVLLLLGTLMTKVIPGVISGIKALGIALKFLTANPIGLTIVAVGLLIYAGYQLYKNWDAVKIKFSEIWLAMQRTVSRAVSDMLDKLEALLGWVPKVGDAIRSAQARVKDWQKGIKEASKELHVQKLYLGANEEAMLKAQGGTEDLTDSLGALSGSLEDAEDGFDDTASAAGGAARAISSVGDAAKDTKNAVEELTAAQKIMQKTSAAIQAAAGMAKGSGAYGAYVGAAGGTSAPHAGSQAEYEARRDELARTIGSTLDVSMGVARSMANLEMQKGVQQNVTVNVQSLSDVGREVAFLKQQLAVE